MSTTELGTSIKELRLSRRVTLRQAAVLAGRTREWVRLVEDGKIARPSLDAIRDLAEVLGGRVTVTL